METNKNISEHEHRIKLGVMASEFLDSQYWKELVKPLLDSFVKGLIDARDIDITSDKKAAIEVKSRVLAAQYLETIEQFLEQYVMDGKVSREMLAPKTEANPLFRKRRSFDSAVEQKEE